MQEGFQLVGQIGAELRRDVARIGKKVEFRDIDHKRLGRLGMARFERSIGINQPPFKRLSDDPMVLGIGDLGPLLPFDDLDFEKLHDERTKEEKEGDENPD